MPRSAPVSISLVTDAIDYELRPRLLSLGGDVWLDEVVGERFAIGYRLPACEPGLRGWLQEALSKLLGDSGDVELRDYSVRLAGG